MFSLADMFAYFHVLDEVNTWNSLYRFMITSLPDLFIVLFLPKYVVYENSSSTHGEEGVALNICNS